MYYTPGSTGWNEPLPMLDACVVYWLNDFTTVKLFNITNINRFKFFTIPFSFIDIYFHNLPPYFQIQSSCLTPIKFPIMLDACVVYWLNDFTTVKFAKEAYNYFNKICKTFEEIYCNDLE